MLATAWCSPRCVSAVLASAAAEAVGLQQIGRRPPTFYSMHRAWGDSLAALGDAMTGNATLAWSSRHLTGVQNASKRRDLRVGTGSKSLYPGTQVIEPLQTAVQFIRHSGQHSPRL